MSLKKDLDMMKTLPRQFGMRSYITDRRRRGAFELYTYIYRYIYVRILYACAEVEIGYNPGGGGRLLRCIGRLARGKQEEC